MRRNSRNVRPRVLVVIALALTFCIGSSLLFRFSARSPFQIFHASAPRISQKKVLHAAEPPKHADGNHKHLSNPVTRILVIAPHPDDETIGTGAVLYAAAHQGEELHVVVLTNGDAQIHAVQKTFRHTPFPPRDFIQLGWIRQQETWTAMRILGVPARDVTFLGFPDGGLASMWETSWGNHPVRGKYTHVTAVPYADSPTTDTPFTGSALNAALVEILRTFQPTQVYCIEPHDVHPDHWASSNFVRLAIAESGLHPQVQYYLVHYPGYPSQMRLGDYVDLPLNPPRPLAGTASWHRQPVADNVRRVLRRALTAYPSEDSVDLTFRRSFARKNTLFAQLPTPRLKYASAFNLAASGALPGSVAVLPHSGSSQHHIPSAAVLQTVGVLQLPQGLCIDWQTQGPLRATVAFRVDLWIVGPNHSPHRLTLLVNGKMNTFQWIDTGAPLPSTVRPSVTLYAAHDRGGVLLKEIAPPAGSTLFVQVESRDARQGMLDRMPLEEISLPKTSFPGAQQKP
ncbi:MAG: PIG-L family deacetylase [Firmicutes bacterium]|nr:PIG-L family deacetylase [Bacillota bacterium]